MEKKELLERLETLKKKIESLEGNCDKEIQFASDLIKSIDGILFYEREE